MNEQLALVQGIHPGLILERELKKRNLDKESFALAIQEFPQTLFSIIQGQQAMNKVISDKIEKKLDLTGGFFMALQRFYDAKIQEKEGKKPDISKLRAILFWETTFEKIHWQKNKNAIIRRVFERGNIIEKNEIERFYGKKAIQQVLRNG